MGATSSWQVGHVRVTPIVEMDLPVPVQVIPQATPEMLRRSPWLYPHFVSDDDSILKLCVQSFLVEAPGLKLLVDTCVGNDRPREITGDAPLQTEFLQDLEAAGGPREAVDMVLCTHLHVDHVGWNTRLEAGRWEPTFPHARYLIGRREYDFWAGSEDAEQRAMLDDSIKPIFDAGLVDLVEMDHVISPELRLIPSGGHTPGHVSVMIESEGERAVITGDIVHHPCQTAHPDWAFGDDDRHVAMITRARLFEEWADQPILVIGSHFPAPTVGHLRRDGDAFRFEV